MTPNKVILHHSLTKDSGTVSWQAIREWHLGLTGSPIKGNPNYNPYIKDPMRAIGYQWGIELVNNDYEILKGRNGEGAHCIGQNSQSIGICVIGNYDMDIVKPGIKDALYDLLVYLIETHHIPRTEIYGHCEFAQKTCPGKNLFDLVKEIRR